jgi:hypothetical protein
MWNLVHHCVRDPLTMLYIAQCITYCAAALAVRFGHRMLWLTYVTSAAVHAGFAVVHQVIGS